MRLAPGTEAPEFDAHTWEAKPVRLADYRGHKLWLAFFRYAACPLCNLRVRDIVKRHDELTAHGMRILGVVQSPGENIAKYMGAQSSPFPLIADPEEKLYRRYGLESSLAGYLSPANMDRVVKAISAGVVLGPMDGTKTRIPADFLIDSSGRVSDAFYGDVIADHIPFDRVERFAAG